jgi:hypothetical protein
MCIVQPGVAWEQKTPDWTHIHGDAMHSGFSKVQLDLPIEYKWKLKTEPAAHANVVGCWIGNTPMIITSDIDGNLISLNPEEGFPNWVFKPSKGYLSTHRSSSKQKKVGSKLLQFPPTMCLTSEEMLPFTASIWMARRFGKSRLKTISQTPRQLSRTVSSILQPEN